MSEAVSEKKSNPLLLIWRVVRGFYLLLIWAYLLLGVAYLVARFTVGETNTLVTLGNLLLHWYLLPALILFPLTLLFRGWIASVGLFLFVLYFGIWFGPLFLPRSIEAPIGQDVEEIRVMTYNSAGGRTRGVDLPALINQYEPDVIGLLEVSAPNRDLIRNTLTDSYPYRIESFGGDDQKVLLSRYPILAEDTFSFRTARTNIEARLDVNGREVSVYLVHPPSPDIQASGINFYLPDPDNALEVAMLAQRISPDIPTILLGDFNFSELSDSHWRLQALGFVDAHRAAGEGFGNTYNMRQRQLNIEQPITRIDYVWHTDHFRTEASQTAQATRSDHIPVIVDLWLLPPAS